MTFVAGKQCKRKGIAKQVLAFKKGTSIPGSNTHVPKQASSPILSTRRL